MKQAKPIIFGAYASGDNKANLDGVAIKIKNKWHNPLTGQKVIRQIEMVIAIDKTKLDDANYLETVINGVALQYTDNRELAQVLTAQNAFRRQFRLNAVPIVITLSNLKFPDASTKGFEELISVLQSQGDVREMLHGILKDMQVEVDKSQSDRVLLHAVAKVNQAVTSAKRTALRLKNTQFETILNSVEEAMKPITPTVLVQGRVLTTAKKYLEAVLEGKPKKPRKPRTPRTTNPEAVPEVKPEKPRPHRAKKPELETAPVKTRVRKRTTVEKIKEVA